VGSLTDFVVAQNIERRHLTSGQRVVLAVNLETLYAAEAKGRQRESGKTVGRGRPKQVEQKVAQAKRETQARDKAAKKAGTNRQYVSDGKKIKAEAPELYAKMASGKMELREAKQEIKEQKKAAVVVWRGFQS
jgi:hypothetical protein